MTHFWIRAETRPNERRTGVTPEGVAKLIAHGATVTVEDSPDRILPTAAFASAGATIAPAGSWPDAPRDAVITGLKELPDSDAPLIHRHIMFGHAYKGQSAGQRLLARFRAGGGTLLDLEYLTDAGGRRVAAFGYWAGYAGAAVALMAWIAQQKGLLCPAVTGWETSDALLAQLRDDLSGTATARPRALIIGALGRVGTGAADLLAAVDLGATLWDMAETAHGGPFPEVLAHEIFLNCILARPGTPVFVPRSAGTMPRALTVIGDIACDPDSDFNPVPVYDHATSWETPALRVHDDPPLDVTAIDNLPSLLPLESSEDFAAQLLPHLLTFGSDVWTRAEALYRDHTR